MSSALGHYSSTSIPGWVSSPGPGGAVCRAGRVGTRGGAPCAGGRAAGGGVRVPGGSTCNLLTTVKLHHFHKMCLGVTKLGESERDQPANTETIPEITQEQRDQSTRKKHSNHTCQTTQVRLKTATLLALLQTFLPNRKAFLT